MSWMAIASQNLIRSEMKKMEVSVRKEMCHPTLTLETDSNYILS
jgi:hypothetical protein